MGFYHAHAIGSSLDEAQRKTETRIDVIEKNNLQTAEAVGARVGSRDVKSVLTEWKNGTSPWDFELAAGWKCRRYRRAPSIHRNDIELSLRPLATV